VQKRRGISAAASILIMKYPKSSYHLAHRPPGLWVAWTRRRGLGRGRGGGGGVPRIDYHRARGRPWRARGWSRPPWPRDGLVSGRGRGVSRFLEQSRRYIGESQSQRPPKRTQRPPHPQRARPRLLHPCGGGRGGVCWGGSVGLAGLHAAPTATASGMRRAEGTASGKRRAISASGEHALNQIKHLRRILEKVGQFQSVASMVSLMWCTSVARRGGPG
jgi:hypothetical protein